MPGAEVRVGTRGRKRVLINCACVRKGSRLAVGVIRRTKLPIHRARIAAGNTVAASGPRSAHVWAAVDIERLGMNIAHDCGVKGQVASQVGRISGREYGIMQRPSREMIVFLGNVDLRVCRQDRRPQKNKGK